jgi:hypothetical protein
MIQRQDDPGMKISRFKYLIHHGDLLVCLSSPNLISGKPDQLQPGAG